MKAKKDIYADKDGNITDDPLKYASQIAVAGHELDDRIARRYGIEDQLVSVDEPNAVRRVTGRSQASVKIQKAEDVKDAQPEPEKEPAKAAEADAKSESASPEVEKPKTEAKKKPAAKGAKKK